MLRRFAETSVVVAMKCAHCGVLLIALSQVVATLGEKLAGTKLAAVLCVAGGWAGGNAASGGQFFGFLFVFFVFFPNTCRRWSVSDWWSLTDIARPRTLQTLSRTPIS